MCHKGLGCREGRDQGTVVRSVGRELVPTSKSEMTADGKKKKNVDEASLCRAKIPTKSDRNCRNEGLVIHVISSSRSETELECV